jgi:hypothetical protein
MDMMDQSSIGSRWRQHMHEHDMLAANTQLQHIHAMTCASNCYPFHLDRPAAGNQQTAEILAHFTPILQATISNSIIREIQS